MSISSATEAISAANKAAIETFLAIFNTSLNSAEKISSLQFSSTRSALAEGLEGTKNLLGSKDFPASVALQGTLPKAQIDQFIAYARGLYDISTDAHEELLQHLENQHAELNRSATSLLDWYANSTGHADITVAAVKSAISAGNSAFVNVNKAARQVADLAGAGVNAATGASVRALGTAAAPKKKAA